jgi:hypothetical protein
MNNERGMILMTSLAILSALMLASVGVRMMLQNDYRVLTNLRGATEAFYFSVAGLEWAKSDLLRTSVFPLSPRVESRNFSTGGFSVFFVSAAAVSPLSTRVVLRSTGTGRNGQHVLQAQVTKSYDLADAAVGVRGNGAGIDLSGEVVFLSGADHDANGIPLPAASPRRAVSTSDDGLRTIVEQALGSPPRSGVIDQVAGAPAISTSEYLPTTAVSQMANDLCASPSASIHAMPTSGSLTIENQTWGNNESTQFHCFDGLTTSGDAVTMAGSFSGSGILIVRNADLVLAGTFRWEGLIIVTGENVSLKTIGPANKNLIGAVVVNETGLPGIGRSILDLQGNIRILFSRHALSRTTQLIPPQVLDNLYESLPAGVTQNYWRALSS